MKCKLIYLDIFNFWVKYISRQTLKQYHFFPYFADYVLIKCNLIVNEEVRNQAFCNKSCL